MGWGIKVMGGRGETGGVETIATQRVDKTEQVSGVVLQTYHHPSPCTESMLPF